MVNSALTELYLLRVDLELAAEKLARIEKELGGCDAKCRRLPNLARRDEMPEWLQDLIEKHGFGSVHLPGEFWVAVHEWQNGRGDLPPCPNEDWTQTLERRPR